MQMTSNLIQYIRENMLSIEEISRETGVEANLLQEEQRSLDAAEMLAICEYLQIDPWCLFKDE